MERFNPGDIVSLNPSTHDSKCYSHMLDVYDLFTRRGVILEVLDNKNVKLGYMIRFYGYRIPFYFYHECLDLVKKYQGGTR